MTASETAQLAEADGHVADAHRRIALQLELIRETASRGRRPEAAERLLAVMLRALPGFEDLRQQLLQVLTAK